MFPRYGLVLIIHDCTHPRSTVSRNITFKSGQQRHQDVDTECLIIFVSSNDSVKNRCGNIISNITVWAVLNIRYEKLIFYIDIMFGLRNCGDESLQKEWGLGFFRKERLVYWRSYYAVRWCINIMFTFQSQMGLINSKSKFLACLLACLLAWKR